ncbi:GSS [Branchiostoma lanceolatum]|uniref:Glutathione synthetase n=1 Tax=Branchiostoma lanceolatum TaxID=7740 RepID=A0A8K0EH98_BRALA|nr:GSS [Branchiostoma lanceolatum]
MEPVVPLPLDPSTLASLTESAKDYATLNPLAYLTPGDQHDSGNDRVHFIPFALLPSPVPRALFDQARAVQQDFNLLVHRVSHDMAFLTSCLSSVVKVDDFTASLFRIYEQVQEEGVAQPICLGLFRSDYLLSTDNDAVRGTNGQLQLKQTEIQTVATAGAGFGEKVAPLYRHVLHLLGVANVDKHLPENRALECQAGGFIAAWEQYGSQKAIIVFVIEEERCSFHFDQRLSEFAIMDRYVKLFTSRDMAEDAELKSDKTLFMWEWSARLKIERSRAIKCPCISYHLAGTKKVQQVLSQPGVLEKFLEDPKAVDRVRATFAGQHTLDMGLDGDRTVQMAIRGPEDFVMKPQREGGGNNIYGEDIRTVLNKLKDSEERTAYIIMDRIRPAVVQNYFIKAGDTPKLLGFSSELGMFGVFLASEGDRVFHNKQGGHFMRTFDSRTDGGIDIGNAVLDSPYLV